MSHGELLTVYLCCCLQRVSMVTFSRVSWMECLSLDRWIGIL